MSAVRAVCDKEKPYSDAPPSVLVYTILQIYFTKINSIFKDFMIN